MEEGVLLLADIDEGGVHSLHYSLDTAEEDRSDMAFLVGEFEEYFS